MLAEDRVAGLRGAHRDFERARSRVWLERIRVGLDYRRAIRQVEDGVTSAGLERDRRIREAVADGASYREVGRALGLSHSRIQQIVNDGREGTGEDPAR
jgi:hypothetical protein